MGISSVRLSLIVAVGLSAVACDGERTPSSTADPCRPREAPTQSGGIDTGRAASGAFLSSSHIVFVNNRDGDREIYSVNADGSRLVQLTKNQWDDDEVAASPDGRRLAFPCGEWQDDLCVIGPDGRRLRHLKGAWPAGWSPDGSSWSPDGSKLAYRDQTGLAVVGIDGAKQRLTRSADDAFIDWSPDGRLVLVARSTSYQGPDDLYTVCLAEGTLTKVASGIDPTGVAWSPRTSTIVYLVRGDAGRMGSSCTTSRVARLGRSTAVQRSTTSLGPPTGRCSP